MTIRATYCGTTAIHIADSEGSLFVDPFFTRPPLLRSVLGRVSPDPTRIEEGLRRAGIADADAIFLSHTHHDHAMDAGDVAAAFGCTIYGSNSALNIRRARGKEEPARERIRAGECITVGNFTVAVTESEHSCPDLAPGHIRRPFRQPSMGCRYRSGECFSLRIEHPRLTVHVHPSAGFIKHALDGQHADVLYLGIAGLGRRRKRFRDAYWRHVVEATSPRVIVPIHWDHFGRPVAAPPDPLPWPMDSLTVSRRFLEKQCGKAITLYWQQPFEALALTEVVVP